MAGIYVHVPFCTAKCAYCDFYSVARPDYADAYIGAVEQDYVARIGELGGEAVETLYFGGGTPSLLSPGQFGRLASIFDISDLKEFTIEVNPDDVSPDKVKAWIDAGVDRVSIGVQSLDDGELRTVGRRHDSRQALSAIELLQRSGISNISGDLVYGLPGQTAPSFVRSLNQLISSGIKHLSAYSLGYEEGTRLWRWLQEGRVVPADDDLTLEMYTSLCRVAASAGFEHYEISNFALPGFRSLHNSAYWCGTPYLGLGPGAHSLDSCGVRRYVPSDIKTYLKAPCTASVIDEEDNTDRANDRIMVSLRTAGGLDLTLFDDGDRAKIEAAALPWLESGDLVESPSGFAIPERSWMLSDAIIRDLLL